ncbi:uncharacterized protein TRAVEDRAFT_43155 [Trametes versicolor FP-101664 SS1]|uniref:uncharacterized protein n=1 Tax=Trametes versicolor (strain FP-101664) TaxID=717944 RepID=UPI000462139C|nr:uncharacterized protein TRAVEDRAFT_43155 [Trametes versicolor FP-101664 SS1]EIW62832.1 hypothetical protein TRAVEDRAFT_43155 [Trametes versicolor FP-101664 SS1]
MSTPSPSPGTSRTTDAPHPFNLPSADLILRTADLVDFRVHTLFLALASSFFATMLTLPQPAADSAPSAPLAGTEPGTPPVVPVSEDSATLELLLRLVYPISKPRAQMEDPQTIVPALRAAVKYEMELPVDILSERLVAIIPKSPLQVWAAACRTGQEDVACQAAVVLRTSWIRDDTKEVLSLMDDLGDMSGISAADYLRLKQFLKAEQSAIDEGQLTLLSPPIASPPAPQSVSSESPLPFSTKLPSPDVVCRSSSRMGSQTDFAAHQVVMSMYSPVLEARLAELRDVGPISEDRGSTPAAVVLDFDEDADVLSALLKACYSLGDTLPADHARLAEVLVASRKYKMVAIERKAREAWDKAAALHPLEAYFVAINHGLHKCAEEAARNALRESVVEYTAAMESAPALAYHHLLVYFDACRQIFKKHLEDISQRIPDSVYAGQPGHYGYPQSIYTTAFKNAVTNYVASAHGVPTKATIQNGCQKKILNTMSTEFGNITIHSLFVPLIECMTSAADAIESAINDVRLQLVGAERLDVDD